MPLIPDQFPADSYEVAYLEGYKEATEYYSTSKIRKRIVLGICSGLLIGFCLGLLF